MSSGPDRAPSMVRNMLSLYMFQGLQFVAPLLLIPLLIRRLGTESFGILTLCTALSVYLQVVCDYGLQITATQRISVLRNAEEGLARYVSSILWSKVALALLASGVYVLVVFLVPGYAVRWREFGIAGLTALAGSFLPSWYFQGLERSGAMVGVTALGRLLQIAFIFLFVRSSDDLLLCLSILSATTFLTTALAWRKMLVSMTWRICPPEISAVRRVLREGFEVFTAQAGVLLFANTNVLVLGIFASTEALGRYAIGEKVVRAIVQLSAPVTNALLPRTSALLSESPESGFALIRKAAAIGGGAFLVMGIALATASPAFLPWLAGPHSEEISRLVWILCPLPLLVFLDNLLGTQILLNLGHRRIFLFGTVSTGLVALILQAILVPAFQDVGAALSLLASSAWILLFFAIASSWAVPRARARGSRPGKSAE